MRVDAALWFARALLNIHIEELNRELYALNVQNGVIDLHTGELREHRRTDFITRCCLVAYDPKAKAPKWDAFLRRIFADNVAVIDFVQRAAGYSLTGDTGEQCLFILHGSGANGKSVLLEVLGRMLGAYAKQAAPDLLLAKNQDRHPTELADLFGSRLVTAIETSEGRRLAEALVKQMTGGDKMKARFMRQDFFEFDTTHKLWLATNHKPQVRGTDYAIWRRIRLIPFEVTIPEDKRDPKLAAKLIAEELPGILTWAVQGCLAWQEKGLKPPEKVQAATKAYREEMDVLAGFLDECCEINQDPHKAQLFTTTAKELYEVYKQWCDRNGEYPETQRSFGMRLTERGLEREKGRYGWSWKGIRVLPQQEVNTG
jgi:putative DNA primase/helicase